MILGQLAMMCADKRISVYGYIIYFFECSISWKSREMRSVLLSSSESEYVAVSEVIKECKFIVQLLEDIDVKFPIQAQVENVGATWLSNNKTIDERTKSVDIRAHFVCENVTKMEWK